MKRSMTRPIQGLLVAGSLLGAAACQRDRLPVEPLDAAPNPTPDAVVDVAAEAVPDASPLAARCESTGGQVTTTFCCRSVQDFPNDCLVGACGCAPQNSHPVATCTCPPSTCFMAEHGCVPATSCTPGMDHSCNANPAVSSLRGHCNPDMTCTCVPGSTLNPATGKCS
jgi:hypothetical protein